jgi:hypothetical protein
VQGQEQNLISPAPPISASSAASSYSLRPISSHAESSKSSAAEALPSDAWFAAAAKEATMSGWMTMNNGLFEPQSTVTISESARALLSLKGMPIPSDTSDLSEIRTLNLSFFSRPQNPRDSVTKDAFLQMLAELFRSELQGILRTKSAVEYTQTWNIVPASAPHANAVRIAILAGWIRMPSTPFRGNAPLSRAEMAQILVNVKRSLQPR